MRNDQDNNVTIIDEVEIIDPTRKEVNVPLEMVKSVAPYIIGIATFLVGFIYLSRFLDTL